MGQKAPGKAYRKGLSLVELMDMFPDEDVARVWIESVIWPNGRCCGKCGSTNTRPASHKTMPYWCTDCRGYFSVKTGTPLASSNIPLRKWAIAIYLCLTSLKSVSSMKLHRDLKVSQKTAWFMLHRIREAWMPKGGGKPYDGPVEVDETYFGGKRANMSNANGRCSSGRTRDVPQDVPEAPEPLCQRVHRQAQCPRIRHPRPDARTRHSAHGPPPRLPEAHRRQRTPLRGAVVAAPRVGTWRASTSRVSRPRGRGRDPASVVAWCHSSGIPSCASNRLRSSTANTSKTFFRSIPRE